MLVISGGFSTSLLSITWSILPMLSKYQIRCQLMTFSRETWSHRTSSNWYEYLNGLGFDENSGHKLCCSSHDAFRNTQYLATTYLPMCSKCQCTNNRKRNSYIRNRNRWKYGLQSLIWVIYYNSVFTSKGALHDSSQFFVWSLTVGGRNHVNPPYKTTQKTSLQFSV